MLRDGAQAVFNEINRKLGLGAVVLASDIVVAKRYSTGSLSLDLALGGGLPGNQWTEVIGKESSGKTAMVLKTVAANQRLDPDFTTFWVAAEHYDFEQAEALGVDNDRVVVSPIRYMEVAFDLILKVLRSKEYDCIVLDSYPALLTAEEDEKIMEEVTVSAGARLFNKFWRKAGADGTRASDNSERPFLGIIINQYRDKIGGYSPQGTPQTSPGGHGKDYAFYTRVEVGRDEYLTEKRPGIDQPVKVGQKIRFKTIKNKSAAPMQLAYVDFYFRGAPFKGFLRGDYDVAKEYITMGILFSVIRKSTNGWYYYADRKWHGEPSLLSDVRAEIDLQQAIRADVLQLASNPAILDQLPEEAHA